MNPPPKNQVGRLEIFCLAVAVCLAGGSFLGLWPFRLPIAFVFLAVLYGVLRDMRSLNQLNHPVPAQPRTRNVHAEQTDRTSR